MGKGGVGRRGWKFPGENGPCVLTAPRKHLLSHGQNERGEGAGRRPLLPCALVGVGGEGRRGEAAPCPECRAGLWSPEGRQGGRQALLGVGKGANVRLPQFPETE